MKVKPSRYYFLIPILILLIGGTISSILLYNSVIKPLRNIEEITINETFDLELTDQNFITLYIKNEKMVDYEFEPNGAFNVFRLYTLRDEQGITIECLQLDALNPISGYEMTAFEQTNAYTFNNFINYGQIDITESATYRFTFNGFEDENTTLGYIISDETTDGLMATSSIWIGSISVGLSIISFSVILYLRGKQHKLLAQQKDQ